MDTPVRLTAVDASNAAVDEVWASVSSGTRATVVDSPPGAGKSTLVREIARRYAEAYGQIPVVAQTNSQADDLIRGFIRDAAEGKASSLTIGRLHSGTYDPPGDIASAANVLFSKKITDLSGCDVIVAPAKKWVYVKDLTWPLAIVDEAYQMRSDEFISVGNLADRVLLVGDPGQLDPFTTADPAFFRGDPLPPTGNAAATLLATHPNATQIVLPLSWRLDARAADVVSDSFYRQPFQAAHGPSVRHLTFPMRALDTREQRAAYAAADLGWAYLELEPALMPEVDPELVTSIAAIVETLIAGRGHLSDELGERPLLPGNIAVGVAHTSQRVAVQAAVGAVCEAMGLAPDAVVVDSANRLQGREFEVVVVWHPLSGRRDATEFHVDAGRLCVLTSRHRHACIVVGRAGMREQLEDHPSVEDVWVNETDYAVDGVTAQLSLLDHLEAHRV